MAADFKLVGTEKIRTTKAVKASETVIEAGDLVEIASGLIIKGTATGAKLAYCPNGAAAGTTDVEITVGNDFELVGTGDAVFADAQRGTEVDLVVDTTVQKIDVGESTTDVLTISPRSDAGVVGVASGITVRINKPIY